MAKLNRICLLNLPSRHFLLQGTEIELELVQFSRSVVSDSLRSHELQHTRPPCPSPTPGVYSNPCPSSQWYHPAISSSVIPFSSCPQSLPASGSFPMSQLFTWGGQSTGVVVSASVLPMNTQGWSPLGWTGWISLQSKELTRVFSSITLQKYQFLQHSAFFTVQLSHPYMTPGKTIALTRQTFVGKLMSLLFNMLSKLVITFLPRNKQMYANTLLTYRFFFLVKAPINFISQSRQYIGCMHIYTISKLSLYVQPMNNFANNFCNFYLLSLKCNQNITSYMFFMV